MDPEILSPDLQRFIAPAPEPPPFTDEDVLAGVVPGYVGPQPAPATQEYVEPQGVPAAGPAQQYGLQPTAPQPPPVAPPQNVSASAQGKGFSPGSYAALSNAKGPEGDLRRAQASVEQRVGAESDALVRNFDSAASTARVAQELQNKAQQDYDTALAGNNAWLAQRDTEAKTAEEEAHARAAAGIAQARANYVASLNDVRSAPNILSDMSEGLRLGTLASVFVADFLAAGQRPIKTSVMDTINTAIDRRMRTAVEVSQGLRTAYEMQRQEAASDEEARARVRGLAMEAFKQEVMARMGKYSSALNQAKGTAALAAIDAEQAKNLFEVYKHIDQTKNAQLQQELSWQVAKMNNAQESWRNSIAQKGLELQQAKQLASQQPDFIYDPESGQAKWAFRPNIEPTTRDKVRDQVGEFERANGAMNDLRALSRKIGSSPDYINKTRLASQDQRDFDAAADRLAHSMLKALGERATDEDVKQMRKGLGLETWAMNGGTERILAHTQTDFNDRMQGTLRQYTIAVPPDVAQKLQYEPPRASAGSYEDAKATRAGGENIKDNPADAAVRTLATPHTENAASDRTINDATHAGVTPRADWEQFAHQHPDVVARTGADPAQNERLVNLRANAVPTYAVGLTQLRAAAENGDARALALLEQWAGAGPNHQETELALPDGTDPNSLGGRERREFARHELDLMQMARQSGVVQ